MAPAPKKTAPVRKSAPAGQAPYDPFAPWTPGQIDQVATSSANMDLAPEQLALQQQRALANRQATSDVQTTSGYSQALANLLGGVGKNVSDVYNTAADNQDHYAKGFSSGLQMVQQQEQGKANSLLNAAGAPSSQQQNVSQAIGGTANQDVLYGVGGYIPASNLNREGAAFGAAASQLPATSAMLGQEAMKQVLAKNALTQNDISNQFAQLAAKFPALKMQVASQLFSNEMQKAQARLGQEKFGYEVNRNTGNDAFDHAYKSTLLQLRQNGLISQDQYRQQMVQLRQGSLGVAQKNADIHAAAQQATDTGYYVGADGKPHPTLARQNATRTQTTQQGQRQQASLDKAASTARSLAFKLYTGSTGSASSATNLLSMMNQMNGKPGAAGAGTSKGPAIGYQPAFNRIYRALGSSMKRQGFKDADIRSMIDDQLAAAGFTKPGSPKPASPFGAFLTPGAGGAPFDPLSAQPWQPAPFLSGYGS